MNCVENEHPSHIKFDEKKNKQCAIEKEEERGGGLKTKEIKHNLKLI